MELFVKLKKSIVLTFAAAFITASAFAAEGDILWQKNGLGENLESAPAVDDTGNVYVIASGTVYSYTSFGTLRWSTATSGGDGCTPSVSPDNTVLYTCGTNGVYALDASNGSQIWHVLSGTEFATVPCVSPDGLKIYIASEDLGGSGTIFALNASNGGTAWSYHPSGADGFMAGAALDEDGNIYIPGQDGILYSLSDNGISYSLNWTFDLGSEARQPVTVGDDGYIYATCNTGIIHKINAITGIEDTSDNWPALGGIGEVFASMCFGPDGTLYVNAEDFKLHAVNPDGSEKWTYTFDAWGSDPLVRDDGKIIVMGQVDSAGRVCCLSDNGTSAALDWSSDPILSNLTLNETNVNIGPDGTIYVHSGDQSPLALFAIEGNGQGLNTSSPWPKYMCNIQNNGIFAPLETEIPLTNPSFESGATGWSNITVDNSEFYSPVDGEYYSTRSGGSGYTSQLTNHTIAAAETLTLTVWARSTNSIGNTNPTTVEVKLYYDANEITSVTKDVNPVRLLGDPLTETNDDGGNVWIDNGYRHEFAETHMYQDISNDPLTDPWYVSWDDHMDYHSLDAWAVGPVIVPGHKWVYGDYADDSVSFAEIRFIEALSGGTPAYDWTNDYTSVLYTNDGDEDPWVIDPHLYYDEDTGRLWMSWGGGTLWVCEMDPNDGMLIDHPVDKNYNAHPEYHTPVAYWNGDEWTGDNNWFEGPALYKHGGHWYLFGSYGNLGENYTIRVGRGTSPTGPFYDKEGVAMTEWDSSENEYGNTLILGADGGQDCPGHPHIWQESDTYYMGYDYVDEYDNSRLDRFGIRKLYWVDNWPVVAYTPITVTFNADFHLDAVGHKLGISFRNTGSGSNAAFDYVTLTASNYQGYSGGTGASHNPYLIATPEDIDTLGKAFYDWDEYFVVVKDINLAGCDINTVGYYNNTVDNVPFTGSFDGNNHTFSNFDYNSPADDYIGFFGYVADANAHIFGLHLTDANVTGDGIVGSLVGKLSEGSITNCTVRNSVVSGNSQIGGLAGLLEDGQMTDCYYHGAVATHVNPPQDIGGLIGYADSGSVTDCYSEASVTGGDNTDNLGGLIGRSLYSDVNNCYALASVTGGENAGYLGGLIGRSSSSFVDNCYALADVNAAAGSIHVGGLVGRNFGSVANSYAKGIVSGDENVGGLVGYNGVNRGGPSTGTIFNCYAAANITA
ncbi:MAG: GLUG motif-containing protein, partial [Planctomycetota bacterium]